MIRRSMVLFMVLLTVALLTPKSALAAKDGTTSSNYRVNKVFVVDNNSNGGDSVSATFTCVPVAGSLNGSLSGSFFYQLNTGASFYGDIMEPATCPFITQSNGTWSTLSSAITATVTVENIPGAIPGTSPTGTITLVFQNAKNGHNFTSTNTSIDISCPPPSISPPPLCVSLTLTSFLNTSTPIPVFPAPMGMPSNETSASLLLSVRG